MPDAVPRRPRLDPQPNQALAVPLLAPTLPGNVPRLASAQLFGQASEVHIEHGDAVYRLRITSLGKLILTK